MPFDAAAAIPRRLAFFARLAIEKRRLLEAQTVEDLLDARGRERADTLAQLCAFDASNLRNDDDALFGEVALTGLEEHVAGLIGTVKVRAKRAHHRRRQAAVVQGVDLNHDVGMRHRRQRAPVVASQKPVDFALIHTASFGCHGARACQLESPPAKA